MWTIDIWNSYKSLGCTMKSQNNSQDPVAALRKTSKELDTALTKYKDLCNKALELVDSKERFHERRKHERESKRTRKQNSAHANKRTRKIIRIFRHFGKLIRPETIWIQSFHWPNITTCGKYPCACVTPEWYFVFTCCSGNTSISPSTRERKYFDPWARPCA